MDQGWNREKPVKSRYIVTKKLGVQVIHLIHNNVFELIYLDEKFSKSIFLNEDQYPIPIFQDYRISCQVR